MDSYDQKIDQVLKLFKKAERVVAFTGAGISTESGISDFRSPGGVWDRYRVVTYQEFLTSHESRVEYWAMKKELYKELKRAKPNRAHTFLVNLEKRRTLTCLITQNIDGLHQEAGTSPDLIIELHGTNRKALCVQCRREWPIEEIHERLEAGEDDPVCETCDGFIKPATISFGQAMPEAEMIRAYACASRCDLFLMIGSSLQVEPAASIPPAAHRAGAELIFINRTATPWDSIATVSFQEDAGEVLEEVRVRLARIMHE